MTYTVQRGDSLSSIASKFLGSTSKYMEIYNLNTDILDDPNTIEVGMVLKLPATATAPVASTSSASASTSSSMSMTSIINKIKPLLSNTYVIIGAAATMAVLVLLLTKKKGK